ncbi:ATP-dependent helicase [Rugosimonospora africana]|uniref:DNA 3'-5' helicase n=1 Tax=Rugosimonospora africana TaxID=556532 RepID=A0A8J3VND5_9ACTN|nr:ATP-dependent DNA helicase [Rugosimonospora africana]GIH12717.1 ATP-dependent DNA helicase [Rugosimonospora africana]
MAGGRPGADTGGYRRLAGRAVSASAGPRYTPVELSRLLGLRHPPTPEQVAIISAPLTPLLVVAGAGSGKTETMAARVVWLVANGYVRPEQILGLTFTRKAAGELAHRVRARLSQLVRRLGRDDLITGEPAVATYHSYAARIVTEHGLRAGFEPTNRLLTEASCWQLADAVVRAYDGDMSEVAAAPSTVTDAVLHLAGDLAEHLVRPDQLAGWTGRFHAEVNAAPGRVYRDVSEALKRQRARLQLLPLVRAYTERKRALEAMDFGDQLARAALVARDHPEVGAIERDRYRVVLLDEYQDTSHAQVVLLRALYGDGHPVTAVGDPCQSIYGWRGASAGTLDRFRSEFPHVSGEPAARLQLSTSWRNRPEILRVANALSEPLRAFGHQVARLSAAPSVASSAGVATVRCALLPTYADEAEWIADRIVAAWHHAAGSAADPAEIPVERRPTSAVLIRVRAQIPAIEAALRARGLPVDVVGLGGLLDTPEVRDVVSTLRILADPAEGAALLRLLTGPRWRIGARDLVGLYQRARIQAAGLDRRPGRDAEELVTDRLDEATLAEALDDLGDPARYSAEGHRRFAALAAELRALRRRLDQPLPDLIADIERTIGLDVEVATRPGDAGLARAHLDAFGEVAARFASEADAATLTGFLAYLEAAESEERGLPSGEVEVVEGAVQILTGHAAKGLEWDVVAVAGMSAGIFPGGVKSSDHYLGGLGVLPFPLRGDRSGLPELRLSEAANQKAVAGALTEFGTDWRAHDEREERRLAYVAVTRPRRLLLCSGYWWSEGTKRPRGPSPFLEEIRAVCLDGAGVVDLWTAPPEPDETNPTAVEAVSASWPADPLGARRPALEHAAELVRAALGRQAGPVCGSAGQAAGESGSARQAGPISGSAGQAAEESGSARQAGPVSGPAGQAAAETQSGPEASAPPETGDTPNAAGGGWAHEVDLLLAERARLTRDPNAPVDVTLAGHLTVSQLVALRRSPESLARTLRRPLPARPDPYARRGTAFHAWMEQRFGADELLDLDELPGAADEGAAPDDVMLDLRKRFEESEWADRQPLRVEVPFSVTVAGVIIRGRMDAVFQEPDGRYDVVDWKTGRRPSAGRDAAAAAVQLAAYRIAWAELAGVPVDRVRAAFHYVAEGITVRPADLLDLEGLNALLTALPVGDPET